jgi:hypothetical protein
MRVPSSRNDLSGVRLLRGSFPFGKWDMAKEPPLSEIIASFDHAS